MIKIYDRFDLIRILERGFIFRVRLRENEKKTIFCYIYSNKIEFFIAEKYFFISTVGILLWVSKSFFIIDACIIKTQIKTFAYQLTKRQSQLVKFGPNSF